MSDRASDFRRVVSASGVYAAAAVAQRGLAFLLLPVYTRLIDPEEYGKLELLTTFSTIVFGILMMGLPSAIMKCYHRDCDTPRERASLLPTAIALAAPVLMLGAGLLFFYSPSISAVLLGTREAGGLVRLVLATGFFTGLSSLLLANLRAAERAVAFSALTSLQFLVALSLNIVLVVHYGMGVKGILWGNLGATIVTFLVASFVALRSLGLSADSTFVAPLLRFGLLLVPVVLSGWVINMSDRYLLRLFTDLSEVAVYGVGYKFGMIIELIVVWPFQLAWPTVSFSISQRQDHRKTYAIALTYLTVVLVYFTLGLSLLTRVALLVVVGEGYREAYRVVPLVALAYSLNGIQYCVSPGVHLSKKTHYLTYISIGAAVLNLALNFVLIPTWRMMGAAWSTIGAFFLIATVTFIVSRRSYAVDYEYGRLAKIIVIGLLTYLVGVQIEPSLSWWSIAWHVSVGLLAFPIGLLLSGFFTGSERSAMRKWLARVTP